MNIGFVVLLLWWSTVRAGNCPNTAPATAACDCGTGTDMQCKSGQFCYTGTPPSCVDTCTSEAAKSRCYCGKTGSLTCSNEETCDSSIPQCKPKVVEKPPCTSGVKPPTGGCQCGSAKSSICDENHVCISDQCYTPCTVSSAKLKDECGCNNVTCAAGQYCTNATSTDTCMSDCQFAPAKLTVPCICGPNTSPCDDKNDVCDPTGKGRCYKPAKDCPAEKEADDACQCGTTQCQKGDTCNAVENKCLHPADDDSDSGGFGAGVVFRKFSGSVLDLTVGEAT